MTPNQVLDELLQEKRFTLKETEIVIAAKNYAFDVGRREGINLATNVMYSTLWPERMTLKGISLEGLRNKLLDLQKQEVNNGPTSTKQN